MTVVAVIQARMSSSRLPGKVLLDLAGEPVLAWVCRAAATATEIDEVIVATSMDASDDPVVEWCTAAGVECRRGSLDDVLARFVSVVRLEHNVVVRLTADCPFLDYVVIDAAVAAFRALNVHYLSTVHPRSLPRGLDVEVTEPEALRIADAEAEGVDRVHVTSFIWQRPDRFRRANLSFAPAVDHLRLTLDTSEDLELLRELAVRLPERPPRLEHLLVIFENEPGLADINASVVQKQLAEG